MLSDADVEATTNSSTLPGTCPDWEGNNSTLGFGGDLASEAAAINASGSEQAPITAFASGGVLPSLMFDVIDHFGNLVSGTCSTPSPQFHQLAALSQVHAPHLDLNRLAALSQVHAPHLDLTSIDQSVGSSVSGTSSTPSSQFHQAIS